MKTEKGCGSAEGSEKQTHDGPQPEVHQFFAGQQQRDEARPTRALSRHGAAFPAGPKKPRGFPAGSRRVAMGGHGAARTAGSADPTSPRLNGREHLNFTNTDAGRTTPSTSVDALTALVLSAPLGQATADCSSTSS